MPVIHPLLLYHYRVCQYPPRQKSITSPRHSNTQYQCPVSVPTHTTSLPTDLKHVLRKRKICKIHELAKITWKQLLLLLRYELSSPVDAVLAAPTQSPPA